MQVGDGTGDFVHTIVSLGPITDSNGKIIDINTVSNTTDRKNYPLSAYNCPYVRLIKIYGHNNQINFCVSGIIISKNFLEEEKWQIISFMK